jgi:predicted DNA binding CopG/RHH family protein
MRKLKKRPAFKSEKQEAAFWASHDSTEFIDYTKAQRMVFPRLKPSTETISLRLPKSLLEQLKTLANKRDVPYQTLLKLFVLERVQAELIHKTAKAS